MTTRVSESPIPQATPSESNTPSDGTFLFVDDDRAIDHVLSDIMHLNPTICAQVKAWMEHNGIETITSLVEFYAYDPDGMKDPRFMIGATPDVLKNWTINAICIFCTFAIQLTSSNYGNI